MHRRVERFTVLTRHRECRSRDVRCQHGHARFERDGDRDGAGASTDIEDSPAPVLANRRDRRFHQVLSLRAWNQDVGPNMEIPPIELLPVSDVLRRLPLQPLM